MKLLARIDREMRAQEDVPVARMAEATLVSREALYRNGPTPLTATAALTPELYARQAGPQPTRHLA